MYSKQYILVKICFFLSFLSTVPPSLLYFIPERPEWVYPNIQITLSHFI